MPEPASLTTQTIYAELVDRCAAAAFEADFPLNGSFVRVTVKGRAYWYFQEGIRDASGKQRRKYVGADTPGIQTLIKSHGSAKSDYRERQHLIALLRRSGFQKPPEEVGRIVQALSIAGIFRMRACLIGTAAYQVYGPMLGVRLPLAALRTQDLDIAQFTSISLAIAQDEKTPPLLDVLQKADASFRSIPRTRKAEPAVAYINDNGFRVEVLTENRGSDRDTPTSLPAIGTGAQPLRFLDFLIYEEIPAALLHDAGVLVNVPSPARYAIHKLIVAQRRRSGAPKAGKDLMQAQGLIDALALRRPSELKEAWREAIGRGPKWRTLLTTALAALDPEIRDRALYTFGEARKILPSLDLRFTDAPAHYDFSRDAVVFSADAGGYRVSCAISREALEDRFGADGMTKEQRVEIFRKNRGEIQEMARLIYLNIPVPVDGSILVTTADVPLLRRSLSRARAAGKQLARRS